MISGSINYQTQNHLFTSRIVQNRTINAGIAGSFPIFIPFAKLKSEANEYSLLYGRRYISDSSSFSFSGGISYSTYKERVESSNIFAKHRFIGLPVEFNIKWFKSKKSKYRIYELIPVGKPSAIGNSSGFKFLANISENPYVGIGLTLGLGKHKIYD